MSEGKKRLLSGVKPTGRPHIGNYFGAMKQFVDMQDDYENFVFVAEYHALTSDRIQRSSTELHANVIDLVKDYLAIGLDPNKTTLYTQSSVPEVTELTWIFNCLLTVPYLQRAHAYKDAEAKKKNVNVGTFDYPVLMAADILLMDADVVPVGKDQQQHLEIARDINDKFTSLYGETFKQPEAKILGDVATVIGTDGEKMSKSYGNTIFLFSTKEEIRKAVMGIVTDSSGGRPENVYKLHRLLKSEAELEKLYSENENNYKILKEALVEDMEAFIAPMRERRGKITEQDVQRVLKEGGERAKKVASEKMEEVRKKVGLGI